MAADSKLLSYLLDASVILAALFGTLGALYATYALFPRDWLERFTSAATTGLVGACISGIAVGVPALDAAFSPSPGIISGVVGAVIWEAYAFFFFVFKVAPSLEKLDDPTIDMSIPFQRRSQKQPSEIAAWIWLRVAVGGGLGWAGIAFFIAPQRTSIGGYIALTMLLGGIGGAIFGYRSRIPAAKPSYFSFQYAASVIDVLTIVLSALVFAVAFVVAYFTHSVPGAHLPTVFKVLLYIFITPIPVVIGALGFAPFARWQMSKPEGKERRFGVIGIVLVLLAFLIQLIPPAVDLVRLALP